MIADDFDAIRARLAEIKEEDGPLRIVGERTVGRVTYVTYVGRFVHRNWPPIESAPAE